MRKVDPRKWIERESWLPEHIRLEVKPQDGAETTQSLNNAMIRKAMRSSADLVKRPSPPEQVQTNRDEVSRPVGRTHSGMLSVGPHGSINRRGLMSFTRHFHCFFLMSGYGNIPKNISALMLFSQNILVYQIGPYISLRLPKPFHTPL